MDMKREFDLEMQRLSESGQQFAHANPEQARMLNLDEVHDRDPYVERLLEGVAYLTAGVRHEVNASLTDFHDQLLSCTAPELVEPYASTTILQFEVDSGEQAQVDLPAGARVYSLPAGDKQVRAPFATLFGTGLRPLSVARAVWQHAGDGRGELILELSAVGQAPMPSLASLDLFIDAQSALAHALRRALVTRVNDVAVRAAENENWQNMGGQNHVLPIYPVERAERVQASVPGNVALERLQHFFMARETLQFVRIDGLDRVRLPDECQGVEVRIAMQAAPPATAEGREHLLRCNCAPAVNLVRGESDPIRLDHRQTECTVRANADGLGARVVHQVMAAVGRASDSSAVEPFVPLWEWDFAPDQVRLFRTKWRDSGNGAPSLSLMLEDHYAPEVETVSTDILYSHGTIPRLHLGRGDIRHPAADLPEGVGVTNLRRPTPYRAPPARDRAFQALTILARTDLERLATGPAVRGLLGGLDRSHGAEARARIESVRSVDCVPTGRLLRGVLEQGLEVRVSVDGRRLLNDGEISLLGELLHALFQEWAPVDRYVVTRIAVEPGGEEEMWTTT